MEKLCLSLYVTRVKLNWYISLVFMYVICKIDLIRDTLFRHFLQGLIGKWILALPKFNLYYIP
jgi:hypothetical protein